MFTTYVLYSPSFHKIYVGYTSDMKNRFIAHNHPKNKGYTKRYQPWEILVTEPFETKALAMERERQLKTAKGREFVWQQVKLKYER